ncbi:sulfurtransferase [uncultured Metabacillus sp.]|uniref:sulfurtransferase n=1 Tax=Metabacillus sp. Hm71 TaxID=3450743 RepID=UPI002609EA39|nr:sulfurtransferase [uncultured Metabacillus sp.]
MDVRQDQWDEKQVIVDFRDYNNLSDSFVFQDAIFIPIPYLKRYYHEIPSKYVHVIASNKLEINIGIRFLQKHGFHVTGYSLAECSCHNKTTEITM